MTPAPAPWLPPRPRGAGAGPRSRLRALDPARPALRLLTIALLAVLFSLLVWGVVLALVV